MAGHPTCAHEPALPPFDTPPLPPPGSQVGQQSPGWMTEAPSHKLRGQPTSQADPAPLPPAPEVAPLPPAPELAPLPPAPPPENEPPHPVAHSPANSATSRPCCFSERVATCMTGSNVCARMPRADKPRVQRPYQHA